VQNLTTSPESVVVVGGGIAGLRAALAAADRGASVVLLTRTHPTRSYSTTVQDGINAALGQGDSPEQHAVETVEHGLDLADVELARAICRDAPGIVQELDAMGVPFNRDGEALARVQLSGSSRPRTVFADDSTGHIVTHVLYEQALKAGFPILDEWALVDLIVEDSRCTGVVALEIPSGRLETFPAKAVILATGGVRRLYEPSTAALTCNGDGTALAYRRGAALVDMEMVQYHPFVVQDTRLALSEILGLEPSKVVDGAVDLTAHPDIGADRFFATRHRLSGLLGLDPRTTPVPVRPAMHRILGGIAVDGDGATGLSGLYAAGECAGSTFHGASGMAGNFLLESLALARSAGAAAAESTGAGAAPSGAHAEQVRQQFDALLARPQDSSAAGLRRELAELMHEKVGQTRDATGLQAAAARVDEIAGRHEGAGLTSQQRAYNFGLLQHLELGSLLDIARAIIASATAREETRGVHVRADFPARNDNDWARHVLVSWAPEGPAVQSRPVRVK
jgi:succinate dehydrogenase / fumarate reductase, flavoprotein subunit